MTYITESEKCRLFYGSKIIYYMQTWPPDVKKLNSLCCRRTQNNYQIWLVEKLSTWLLSSGQDFNKKFLDSKHVLKVYFKPGRKNQNFWFLPLPSKLASLKNDHLRYRKHFQKVLEAYKSTYVQNSDFKPLNL
jgi:hypothetical protein